MEKADPDFGVIEGSPLQFHSAGNLRGLMLSFASAPYLHPWFQVIGTPPPLPFVILELRGKNEELKLSGIFPTNPSIKLS